MSANGRTGSQKVEYGLLRARVAAEQGDVAAFRSRTDHAIENFERLQADQPTHSDLSSALPKDVTDPTIRGELIGALKDAIERAAHRWPGDANWTRSMASLGRWAYRHGDLTSANECLHIAGILGVAQGIGEHQLWVADLAASLGQPDLAWDIQRGLLEARCLPAVRIPPLLRHLDETGNGESARRLAEDAATWCKVPDVVGRCRSHDTTQTKMP